LIVQRAGVLQPSPGVEIDSETIAGTAGAPAAQTLGRDPRRAESWSWRVHRANALASAWIPSFAAGPRQAEGEPWPSSRGAGAPEVLATPNLCGSVTSRVTTTCGAFSSHPRAVERGTPRSGAMVISLVRWTRSRSRWS